VSPAVFNKLKILEIGNKTKSRPNFWN
jgi:hypothetical protein